VGGMNARIGCLLFAGGLYRASFAKERQIKFEASYLILTYIMLLKKGTIGF